MILIVTFLVKNTLVDNNSIPNNIGLNNLINNCVAHFLPENLG